MKHTPGPWKLKPEHSTTPWRFRIMLADENSAGPDIALTVGQQRHDAECLANAHLIAAAPALETTVNDLIETCEYVVSWLEDAKVHKDIVSNVKKDIKKARQVIVNIEGK